MQDFWPSSGFGRLRRNARGWLEPTDEYLRLFLARPELALVPESCAAEQALHATLLEQPARDHVRLYLVGTFEDRQHARIDQQTRCQVLLGKTVATVHLVKFSLFPKNCLQKFCKCHLSFFGKKCYRN